MFGVLIFATAFQSNAQTTVPFYGFELSNYEVGDTLEYDVSVYWAFTGASCSGKQVFVILDKQFVGTDTVSYSLLSVRKVYCMGAPAPNESTDTFSLFISNDTVLGNSNNLLGQHLIAYDTLYTGFVNFDTTSGAKHLAANLSGFEVVYAYDALENLGLVNYVFASGDPSTMSSSYTLIYANVLHYGIYGTYEPIYLSSEQPKIQNALVEYNALTNSLELKSISNDFGLLRLYDLSGRCVFTTAPYTKSVSLGHLQSGMYFYQLVDKQTAKGKIVVR